MAKRELIKRRLVEIAHARSGDKGDLVNIGLIARTPSGFRVHVEAPWLETLLTWLDGV